MNLQENIKKTITFLTSYHYLIFKALKIAFVYNMNRHRESIRLLYIVRNSLEFPRGILILSIPNSNVEELYILYNHYARD